MQQSGSEMALILNKIKEPLFFCFCCLTRNRIWRVVETDRYQCPRSGHREEILMSKTRQRRVFKLQPYPIKFCLFLPTFFPKLLTLFTLFESTCFPPHKLSSPLPPSPSSSRRSLHQPPSSPPPSPPCKTLPLRQFRSSQILTRQLPTLLSLPSSRTLQIHQVFPSPQLLALPQSSTTPTRRTFLLRSHIIFRSLSPSPIPLVPPSRSSRQNHLHFAPRFRTSPHTTFRSRTSPLGISPQLPGIVKLPTIPSRFRLLVLHNQGVTLLPLQRAFASL